MELPGWIYTLLLFLATAALLAIAVTCIISFSKKGHNTCNDKSSPDKCHEEICNRLLKKDFNHLLILCAVIMVFILVLVFAGDDSAMNYFSFASTISSILLSVVAIILSITGESKTEALKRILKDATDTIEEYNNSAEEQKMVFKDILQNSKDILMKTKKIEEEVSVIKKGYKNEVMSPSESTYTSMNTAKEE